MADHTDAGPLFAAVHEVCCWHISDVTFALMNVRCCGAGKSGHWARSPRGAPFRIMLCAEIQDFGQN